MTLCHDVMKNFLNNLFLKLAQLMKYQIKTN